MRLLPALSLTCHHPGCHACTCKSRFPSPQTSARPPSHWLPGAVWAALLAAHLCAPPQAAAAARSDLEAAAQAAPPHQPAGGVASYVAIALLALAVVAALLALVGIKQDRQQGGHIPILGGWRGKQVGVLRWVKLWILHACRY